MKIRNLIPLVALLALPAAAMAQTPEERVATALDRAEEVGIPVALLESKISEANAKGVAMEQIAMAVERRLEGLTRARDAMARGADDLDAAQVSVAADALENGVNEAVLAEIAATTPLERRTVALAALGQLAAEGIVSEDALQQVSDALARNPNSLGEIPGVAAVLADLPAPVSVGPPASVSTPGQAAPPEAPQRPVRRPPGG
jgi:hypothetical protein